MKNIQIALICVMLFSSNVFAQISVKKNITSNDSCSILDVEFENLSKKDIVITLSNFKIIYNDSEGIYIPCCTEFINDLHLIRSNISDNNQFIYHCDYGFNTNTIKVFKVIKKHEKFNILIPFKNNNMPIENIFYIFSYAESNKTLIKIINPLIFKEQVFRNQLVLIQHEKECTGLTNYIRYEKTSTDNIIKSARYFKKKFVKL